MPRRTYFGAALFLGASLLTACEALGNLGGEGGGGASTSGGAVGGGGSPPSSTTSETGGGGGGGGGSGSAGGGPVDCITDPSVIFAITSPGALYKFDPQAAMFEQGPIPLNCLTKAQALAMVVDGSNRGWALYADNKIYGFDLTTGWCDVTAYVPGQADFFRFGMGITAPSASGPETVFLAKHDGSGLGKLDLHTFAVTPIGDYDLVHQAVDLAGTADGRLFALTQTKPLGILELDPTDAHDLSETTLSAAVDPGAWATVASWGGRLYIFTRTTDHGDPGPDNVWQYDPTTGDTQQIFSEFGLHTMVAVSSSPCAPASPP